MREIGLTEFQDERCFRGAKVTRLSVNFIDVFQLRRNSRRTPRTCHLEIHEHPEPRAILGEIFRRIFSPAAQDAAKTIELKNPVFSASMTACVSGHAPMRKRTGAHGSRREHMKSARSPAQQVPVAPLPPALRTRPRVKIVVTGKGCVPSGTVWLAGWSHLAGIARSFEVSTGRTGGPQPAQPYGFIHGPIEDAFPAADALQMVSR